MDELIRLRHELHRNPELSGHERATGKRIRFFLNRFPASDLFSGIAGEGMAAVYKGNEDGPTVLFRCDLDALPIHESSKIPYASSVAGVSHACGHDGHIAIVSGLASTLFWNPIKRGRAILFYQPEAENGNGAQKSIRALRELGIYPDYAFAIHNMPKHDLGSIILAKNTFAAASKGLVIKLIGAESHAAYPSGGINPSLAVAELIQQLNSFNYSQEYKSFVLTTIIHIRVGEVAFGTSPGHAEMMITLRAFNNFDMNTLTQNTLELAQKISKNHGLAVETRFTNDFPAAVSNPELTTLVENIAIQQNRKVTHLEKPNQWSEDFSHFTLNGTALIFGLGVGNVLQELHSPNYDFPDAAIKHGVDLLDALISHYLR